ncbi:hypothetical protein BDV25DRAFT_131699 [Aspergillus avenaceus]|uniref:Uncharacterized protein n=1 Tax=Aspergillus avenaceus TaxID=36643 RepID=A0A5N6TNQ3_ASPAV|nr:hypothetical protein BDV25DRAFT_131699 [Aspergillus avenaceus]
MDQTVVEGISTSLQTCPPDLEGLFALEDLPSPPYFHDLHLQFPAETQVSLQDEDTSPTGGEENASTSPNFESQRDTNDTSNPMNQETGDIQTNEATFNLPERTVDSVGPNHMTDSVEGLFNNPMLDSEAVLRELDAAFASRKRVGDEAFPEFNLWAPYEKKRMLDRQQDQCIPTPGETPSLSSPESSLQPEQGELAPNTPAIEQLQSPNLFFDPLDALFEDADFDLPLVPTNELPGPNPMLSIAQEESPDDESFTENPTIGADSMKHALEFPECAQNISPTEPSISETTKERFHLGTQDLISNSCRETLQRVQQQPDYTSPYPAYGGPLGYLPSAPGLHIRCIEVADERLSYRLSGLKEKVNHLSNERNKYKNAWFQWTTIDPATGKTKEQLLREENAMLRRVSTQHQNRVEQYKREAIEWKNKLHDLGTIYNNLLYEIHVQRQLPAVAPVPSSYKPPRLPQVSRGQSVTPAQQVVGTEPAHGPQPPNPQQYSSTPSDSQGVQSSSTQSAICQGPTKTRPSPVTIDLTDEMDNASSAGPSAAGTQHRMEMLRSLRNKKYDWLETEPTRYHSHRQGSASQSPLPLDKTAPITERSCSTLSTSAGTRNGSTDDGDDDDELARMMEAELADS